MITLEIPSEDLVIMHKGKLVRFIDHVKYFSANGFDVQKPITLQINLEESKLGIIFLQS